MTEKHRLLAILLALALLLGMTALPTTAEAAGPEGAALSTEEKANALYELGLFRGTGTKADGTPEYDLDKTANRAAGATMLIRLLGKESKAAAQYAAGAVSSPFTDLKWEAATVTWLYANNLANGTGATKYGGTSPISAQQFATFILRALGYSDSGSNPDFSYAQALSFAVQKKVITQEQSAAFQADFRRGGMVEMCYNALYLKMKDSDLTLLEKLTSDGIFKSSYKNNTTVAATKTMTLTQKYKGGGLPPKTYYMEEQCLGNAVCGDLDGDGKLEIVFGVYSIFCVNAADGTLKWRIDASEVGGQALSKRVPFQILDWDGDGKKEVFAMTFSDPNGFVKIIDAGGKVKQSWTINTGYQVRAGCPADLDGDGKYELVVGMGVGASAAPAVYVYNNNGAVRKGWPQSQGYGLFSNSITTVDLDGDKIQEIVLTYDDTQIVAFHADGTRVEAPSFGTTWDKIHFFVNRDADKYNAEDLTTSDVRNGLMGTKSGLIADDLDGDGKKEIIGVALINNIKVTADNMSSDNFVNTFVGSAQYFSPFILNLDRTRYQNKSRGFDWNTIPTDTGSIFTISGEVLSTGATVDVTEPDYRAVTADLDGDGIKEILYTANDGQVHCFSLDGTEHGAWPFALNSRTTSIPDYIRYASQPAVADINGDGKLEVVFTTYTPRGQTTERGKLYVLDYTGKKLAEATLPPMLIKDVDKNYADGCSTAPIVADIDNDKKLEIVVASFNCGLVAYEIS